MLNRRLQSSAVCANGGDGKELRSIVTTKRLSNGYHAHIASKGDEGVAEKARINPTLSYCSKIVGLLLFLILLCHTSRRPSHTHNSKLVEADYADLFPRSARLYPHLATSEGSLEILLGGVGLRAVATGCLR